MRNRQITSAKLLLVNEKDQALMLRIGIYLRHPEKSHTPDLPGGIVNPRESELDAVQRELKEEAGIIIDSRVITLGYAKTIFFEKTNKSLNRLLYVARIDHTPDVKISCEHETYAWTSLETFADTHTMRPFYDEAIRYVVAHRLV